MVNQTEIETVFVGIDYPVDKKGLVRYAKQHEASDETMQALKDIPDQQYNTLEDVQDQLKSSHKEDDSEEDDLGDEA